MLHYINNDVTPTNIKADWLKGIIVAVDFLKEQIQDKKIAAKKIIMFTNFASEVEDASILPQVVQDINDAQIELIVIGANVIPEFNSGNESDLETSFFSQKVPKLPHQEEGEKLISLIIKETNGSMCNFDDAVTELMYFENKQIRPTPWYTNLQIGPDISISICGYKKISDDNCLPTWKRRTTVLDGACEIQRQYFKHSENNSKIDKSDLIPGYQYGATIVPYTSADETMSYSSGPRCLIILGFTKLSNIHREWFSGNGVTCIVARKGYQSSERAFSALVDSMQNSEVVGIARRVYNCGNAPTIQCLLPKITNKFKCLCMIQLPFFEDLHLLSFPPLLGKKNTPNEEQLKAVDSLIDSMDLMTAAETEDGEPMEAYHVKRTLNPYMQHAFQSLSFRAMYKTKQLPPVQKDVLNLINVPEKILEGSQKAIAKIKDLFPLIEKQEMISERNKWINSRLKTIGKEEDLQSIQEAKDILKIQDAIKAELVEVGTVNPSEDFLKLITREDKLTVIKQLQQVIYNIPLKSFDTDYSKALVALRTLRDECIKTHTKEYNDWLKELKDVVLKNRKDLFWSNLVKENLGLITIDENPLSKISQQEADMFLKVSETESVEPPEDIEMDDLFDEM
ncbi:X-ray repair cross-complementing protein 5-like [Ctenocephalides felis]|nr:X-ray repair cross-complementing protein 5-like [Ctenocephalides felis]